MTSAKVTVGERTTGEIGKGVLVFVGVTEGDDEDEAAWLADKVSNLRIFSDDEGKMNRSLVEVEGEVLVVSQFTLYGDARKGRRPSFIKAERGPKAERLYERVKAEFEGLGVPTSSGEFGASMTVSLENDGPVTILLDSDRTF